VTSIGLLSLLNPFFIASVVAVAALVVRPRRQRRSDSAKEPM